MSKSKSLPGNNFAVSSAALGADAADQYEDHNTFAPISMAGSQAQATLALAYEQRTANLIAWSAHTRGSDQEAAIIQQIEARLGLDQEADQ